MSGDWLYELRAFEGYFHECTCEFFGYEVLHPIFSNCMPETEF